MLTRLDRRAISLLLAMALLVPALWAGAPAPALAQAPRAAPAGVRPPKSNQAVAAPAKGPANASVQAAAKPAVPAPAALAVDKALPKAAPPKAAPKQAPGRPAEATAASRQAPLLPRPAPQAPPPPVSQPAVAAKIAASPVPPPANPAPRPGATEIVSARTADSKTFDNHDGTRTTEVSKGMFYQSSPGVWDPPELGLHPQGGAYVEDHSAVTVKVSAAGVEATERSGGQGIRFVTPAAPTVSATGATVAQGGLLWTYTPTGNGVGFSAMVTKAQGPKTYQIPYRLLGGARALAVDA